MADRIKHTTVVLTKVAQEVKEDLAPVFGLKNILSAGLLLFGRLSSDQQKDIIAQANGLKPVEASETQGDLLGKTLSKQLLDRVRFLLAEQGKRQDKPRAKPRAKNA
jgi:hypothetical protein